MKLYKANKKGFINYVLIIFFLLPFFVLIFNANIVFEQPFIFLPLITPFTLFCWIYFYTFYKIEKDVLVYRSGFLSGEIAIQSIKEIIKGKTMWTGLRPALARNGLIIKYNKYDVIYIAPEQNDELINDLLQLNNAIKTTAT